MQQTWLWWAPPSAFIKVSVVPAMSSALMIVDVQQGMFAVSQPLHRGEEVLQRIAGLLSRARAEGIPVVHIQHDGGPGHVLARGSSGWSHHPLVAPRAGEIVVEKR